MQTTGANATKDAKIDTRECVLILGMHRSGSSLMSGVMGKLGCTHARNLMPANFANEKGYFESLPIVTLNDRLLTSAESSWRDWQPLDTDFFSAPCTLKFQTDAVTALNAEFGDAQLFVVKDPRMNRLMPFWHQVFAAKQISTSVVFMHRNPLEIASSIEARDGLPHEYALLLWLANVLDAEHATRTNKRVFISYSQLIDDWKSAVQTITEKLDNIWPQMTPEIEAEIDNLVTPSLKHHTADPQTVLDSEDMSQDIQAAFGIFQSWCDDGENASDHKILDRLRERVLANGPLFGRLLMRNLDTHDALAQEKSSYAAALGRISELESDMEKLVDLDKTSESAAKQDCKSRIVELESEAAHWREQQLEMATELEKVRLTGFAETEVLQSRNARLAEELDEERAKSRHASNQNATNFNNFQRSRERQQQLHKQNIELEHDLKTVLTEQHALKKKNELIEFEKEMLLRSTSWRITKPIRGLRKLFPGS